MSAVKELTHNEFNGRGIQELFEQIMSMSRKLQYKKLSESGSLGRLPFIGVDTLDAQNARVVFQGRKALIPKWQCRLFWGKSELLSCGDFPGRHVRD